MECMQTYVQGYGPELKSGSVDFPVFPEKSVGFGRLKNPSKKMKPKPNISRSISRPVSRQNQANKWSVFRRGCGAHVLHNMT